VNRTTMRGAVALAAGALLLGSCTQGDDGRAAPEVPGPPGQAAATGAWADVSSGTAVPIADITRFVVAPGQVLRYTVASTLQASGANGPATLTVDPTSIAPDPNLLAGVAVTTRITVDGAPVTAITKARDGQTVEAVVTLDFDESAADRTRLAGLDLSALSLVLQQNAR
jgi:alternate signal-mediated exported protein